MVHTSPHPTNMQPLTTPLPPSAPSILPRLVFVPVVNDLHWSLAAIVNLDCLEANWRRAQNRTAARSGRGKPGQQRRERGHGQQQRPRLERGDRGAGMETLLRNGGGGRGRGIHLKTHHRAPCIVLMDSLGMHDARCA